MSENMYCGIGSMPKGKKRGTAEYCVQTNQVRYYGLEAIDEELLTKAKGKTSDIVNEQLKLKKIEEQAKALINEVKKLKIIIENEKSTRTQQKNAQKRLDTLLLKRDKIVKNIKDQKSVVDAIEEEDAKREKRSAKKSSTKSTKSATKTKSSGSKIRRNLRNMR